MVQTVKSMFMFMPGWFKQSRVCSCSCLDGSNRSLNALVGVNGVHVENHRGNAAAEPHTGKKYLCCPARMTNPKITRHMKRVVLLLLLLLLSLLLLLCVSGSH
jgi:hypothetical protein